MVGPNALEQIAPLNQARLTDQVYEQIREMIVSGQFPMGAKLVEVQLAKSFGISRAPIREAMRRLVEDGLVDERPRVGATVRELNADDIIDLYNTRIALEATAIRLAIRNGMNTDCLADLIRLMAETAKKNDHTAVALHELAFHAEIFKASKNALLIRMFHILEGRLMMAIALDNGSQVDLNEVSQEHVPLKQAIDERNEQQASALMEAHIMSTVEPLVLRLKGEPAKLLRPSETSLLHT